MTKEEAMKKFDDVLYPKSGKALIKEVWEAAEAQTAKDILSNFIIAGSALTMFQTEPSLLWAAEELRKSLISIVGKYLPTTPGAGSPVGTEGTRSLAETIETVEAVQRKVEGAGSEEKPCECHCHYKPHNMLLCKCMLISCDHCRNAIAKIEEKAKEHVHDDSLGVERKYCWMCLEKPVPALSGGEDKA